MNFRDRLQQAAKWAGVGDSQASIASSLGLNRQTINRWFQGGEPNADLLLHVARTWRVDAEWLKSGKGDMLPEPSGDGLSLEERDMLRYYRSATPQVRQVISTMVRAVRKSMVAIVLAVPPLLAPKSVEAMTLHNAYSAAVIRIVRRWRDVLMQHLSGRTEFAARFAM